MNKTKVNPKHKKKIEIKPIPVGGNSRSFQTVDEVSRSSIPTKKHEIALGVLNQHLVNLEIELENKHKVMRGMIDSPDTQSSVIHFAGIKIRVLMIEIKQIKASMRRLEKKNVSLDISNYNLARSSRII